MTIDWNEAAVGLKRDVGEHGGFLTMQRDALRERFGIGRLTERITQDLLDTLDEHGMIVFPHPYDMQGTCSASTMSKARSGRSRWPSSTLRTCRRRRSSTP